MVFCIMIGCGNKSTYGKGYFARVPRIRTHLDAEQLERSKRRRRLWVKAISRSDLTESKLNNERVCYKHFVSGY